MVGPIPTDRINSLSSVIRVNSRYSREALCISPDQEGCPQGGVCFEATCASNLPPYLLTIFRACFARRNTPRGSGHVSRRP
jgi:hypothetical protein